MLRLKKILVPLDYSTCSRLALEHAMALAEKFDATVYLLHVWEAPQYMMPEMIITPPEGAQQTLAEYAEGRARKEMDAFLVKVENSGGLKRLIELGDAPSTIIAVAKTGEYDLIVMGTHGRRGITHLLLGSVAEKVVRRAECPVLTIRESGEPAKLR